MNYRTHGFTVADISKATGKSERQINRDIHEEKFDPSCIVDFCEYVIGNRMVRKHELQDR